MKRKANNFTRISIIVLISILSNNIWSQKTAFKLSDLSGKKWEMKGLVGKTNFDHYSDSRISSYLDGVLIGSFEFYLSNSIDTEFDSSKVGVSSEGKYIIKRLIPDTTKKDAPQPRVVTAYEIIELDDDLLIIRNINHKHVLEYKLKRF